MDNITIRQRFSSTINELPKPIFARQVNGPNAQFINAKNKHNKIMKLLSNELTLKYNQHII